MQDPKTATAWDWNAMFEVKIWQVCLDNDGERIPLVDLSITRDRCVQAVGHDGIELALRIAAVDHTPGPRVLPLGQSQRLTTATIVDPF